MKNTSNWNKIPHDILEKIVGEISKNRKLHQCMTINKQWFNIIQSTLYSSITLKRLDFSDPIFSSLINSAYKYGKCVKHITIMDDGIVDYQHLGEPGPSINLQNGPNPLYLLMIHCPYANNLKLSWTTPIGSISMMRL